MIKIAPSPIKIKAIIFIVKSKSPKAFSEAKGNKNTAGIKKQI